MRGRLGKWIITLAICLGVPLGLIWIFMPYLDISHATYLTAQGDYNLSLRALNRALRFNDGIATAYTRRGYVYEKLGSYDDAMSDYNRAIQLSDTEWEPYNNRAWLQAQVAQADLERALTDANQAVSLCGTCAPAFDTRGFIHMKLGQLDKALDDLNHSVGLNRRLGEAYYHRSLCYERMNEPEKARADVLRAHACGFYEDLDGERSSAVPGTDKSDVAQSTQLR